MLIICRDGGGEMANEYTRSVKVNVRIDYGTSGATGNMLTRSISLGSIAAGADKNKIFAVVGALLPCLAYSFARLERVISSEISA
jgi:glyoxylate carboligase